MSDNLKPCGKATGLGPHGWVRLRALAEAVERQATKDPGMRGTLTRACVVCHPESEPQKKIALDTQQSSPSVTFGGSSASGAHEQSLTARRTHDTIPSVTTSTDQNTGTGDVTREVRTGLAQYVTRTSSNDDIGDDVVMEEDNADENRAEQGQTGVEGSQRRGNHAKSVTSNEHH